MDSGRGVKPTPTSRDLIHVLQATTSCVHSKGAYPSDLDKWPQFGTGETMSASRSPP